MSAGRFVDGWRSRATRNLIASIALKACSCSVYRRYRHFIFGVIQSGLTPLIATGIASFPFLATGNFLSNWVMSWLISWATMLPLVVVAVPAIRSLSLILTRDERVS